MQTDSEGAPRIDFELRLDEVVDLAAGAVLNAPGNRLRRWLAPVAVSVFAWIVLARASDGAEAEETWRGVLLGVVVAAAILRILTWESGIRRAVRTRFVRSSGPEWPRRCAWVLRDDGVEIHRADGAWTFHPAHARRQAIETEDGWIGIWKPGVEAYLPREAVPTDAVPRVRAALQVTSAPEEGR